MPKLKLLITGVSGFIGRSLVEEIVNRQLNWDIYGVDIKPLVFNNKKYLKYVNFTTLDIRNDGEVNSYFINHSFDGVIHLAAVSRVVDAENNKENCVQTNYNGTRYIVENVAKYPNTWLIFGSSREVYGEQESLPVKETAEKKPINIYGECKLKGELLVKESINRYAILRFSNVYGNNYDIEGRVIPNFINRALNGKTISLEGGGQIIDFTYIKDTIDCILKVVELLQNNIIDTEELHISPGVENRITDIIDCLESLLNKKLKVVVRERRNYDVVRFVGDSSHRESVLGKMQFKSLQNGIESILNGIVIREKCVDATMFLRS